MNHDDIVMIECADDISGRPSFHEKLIFEEGVRGFDKILGVYRFKDTWIRCGISDCRENHLHGYLISTTDGLETVIGKDCGKKIFSVEFVEQMKIVDAFHSRRRKIETVKKLKNELTYVLVAVENLQRSNIDLSELKDQFKGAVPPGTLSLLQERARKGNTAIMQTVRMTKSEWAAHREVNRSTERQRHSRGFKEISIGELRGLDYLLGNSEIIIITSLLNPLRDLAKLKDHEMDDLDNSRISTWAKLANELPQRIKTAQTFINDGYKFFTESNLLELKKLDIDMGPLRFLIQNLPKTAA